MNIQQPDRDDNNATISAALVRLLNFITLSSHKL